MTTEQQEKAKWLSEFHAQVAAGKVREFRVGDDWIEVHHSPDMQSDRDRWRIRPTPKLRPWRPDEVPVGAMISDNLVGVRLGRGLISHTNGIMVWTTFDILTPKETRHLLEKFVYTTNGGKTWLPCGVKEN